jgi:hypothetical protein
MKAIVQNKFSFVPIIVEIKIETKKELEAIKDVAFNLTEDTHINECESNLYNDKIVLNMIKIIHECITNQ